jgi:plastocyanin
MKFSGLAALTSFAALVAASPEPEPANTVHVDLVCEDGSATVTETVTQTVTIHDGGPGGPGGHNQVLTTTPPVGYPGYNPGYSAPYYGSPSSYVTTQGSTVKSIDYNGPRSTVYAYPSGAPSNNHDCQVAVYEHNVIINIYVVNINIIVNNGVTQTVTVTKTDIVTETPLPPTPPYTPPPYSTQPPYTMSNGTTTTSAGAGSTGIVTPPVVHKVVVGFNGSLIFEPNHLDAAIGDIVRFDFLKLNHTVTQSSLLEPCTPLEGPHFDTGFNQFNPDNTDGKFIRDFTVEVKTPLWFYW